MSGRTALSEKTAMTDRIQRISPFLWFDDNAEEAVNFYVSIFEHSRIRHISRYGEAGQEIHGKAAGSVMTLEFELDGCRFTALNGGPLFRFNEAISLQVHCSSQQEVDYYWDKLGAGGDETAQQCGWLKDKYGLSWQIVPTALACMIRDGDSRRASRVMQAMLEMKKLDIPTLQRAYDGEPSH